MPIQTALSAPSRTQPTLLRDRAPDHMPSPGELTDDDASTLLSTRPSHTPSLLRDAYSSPGPGQVTLMDLPASSTSQSSDARRGMQVGSYPWSNLGALSVDNDPDYAAYQMASRPYFLVKQGSRGVGDGAHVRLRDLWDHHEPLQNFYPFIEAAPRSVALYYVNPFTERREMMGYLGDLFRWPAYRMLTRSLLAVPAQNGPDADVKTLTHMVLAAACFHMGVMVKRDLAVAQVLLQGISPPARTQAFRHAFAAVQDYDLWTLRPYFVDREEIPWALEQGQSLRRQGAKDLDSMPLLRMMNALTQAVLHPVQTLTTCLFVLPKHWINRRPARHAQQLLPGP
jgi:hypothetical protein